MSNRDELLEKYPNLMAFFDDEDLDEERFFVVVDANVEEEADEAEVIDPTEYNWMIYLPERIQEALGDELFAKIPQKLAKVEAFDDFFDAEEDLYGVLSNLDEDKIAKIVLETLETLAIKRKGLSI